MKNRDELFGINLGQALRYVTGDKVYYQRRTENYYNGPVTVIGQENQQVLIKHGCLHTRECTCVDYA